jgi:hypothetical protein
MHSVADKQETVITARAPVGAATAFQVAPESVVAKTTPLPGSDAPLDPTAMHSVADGQATPLSSGVLPPATGWFCHVLPPFFVATITVAEAGLAVASGLATPTAQQRRTVAHESAPRSPVPVGAG